MEQELYHIVRVFIQVIMMVSYVKVVSLLIHAQTLGFALFHTCLFYYKWSSDETL